MLCNSIKLRTATREKKKKSQNKLQISQMINFIHYYFFVFFFFHSIFYMSHLSTQQFNLSICVFVNFIIVSVNVREYHLVNCDKYIQ